MIPGAYAGRFESSEGRGGGILGIDRCGSSGRALSTGVLGTLEVYENPYWRGSRAGVVRVGTSCLDGEGRTV